MYMYIFSYHSMLLGFDQEEINKDFEAKKDELQPKVIEIYEASSTEIKVVCSLHPWIFDKSSNPMLTYYN